MSKLPAITLGVACGLLVACLDEFKPGVLLGSGDSLEVLADSRGSFVRVDGWRRETPAKLTDVALFYALVLEPDVQPTGLGSTFRTDKTTTSVQISWAFGKPGHAWEPAGDKSLTLSFDGRSKVLQVGAQTFDVANGNFFVVTLDKRWAPSAVQLPFVALDQLPLQEALRRVRSHAAAPEPARTVKLYSESPPTARVVPPNP